jgi:hypothetical protein
MGNARKASSLHGPAGLYCLMAAGSLMAMFWVFDYIQRPGDHWLAEYGLGLLAILTVQCTARMAQALTTGGRDRANRAEVRNGR